MEAPKRRSHPVAGEQEELLPERQVLEHEVSVVLGAARGGPRVPERGTLPTAL
jgi:hypothetical protein